MVGWKIPPAEEFMDVCSWENHQTKRWSSIAIILIIGEYH